MGGTVITIAQGKGGAGKTTLAAHLAVGWAAAGKTVSLMDVDPQGSLARWHAFRRERLAPGCADIDFTAVNGWRAGAEVSRRVHQYDVVLIDSPADNNTDARVAIRAAHLVIIPLQPSPLDVWATLSTLELARREKVPVLLVLNRVPARANLTAKMIEWLSGYGAYLARTSIGNRVGLAAALAEGRGITETSLGSLAAEEIDALSREILAILPAAN